MEILHDDTEFTDYKVNGLLIEGGMWRYRQRQLLLVWAPKNTDACNNMSGEQDPFI